MTTNTNKYALRNPALAPDGRLKIDWVQAHMPVLNALREEFEREKPLAGLRVALSIHLEAKTAYLAEVLQAGGAEVIVTGSNPLSTQDDVAAALAATGISVYAWYGATEEEYRTHLLQVLDHRPQILLDDGGDLVGILHTERREQAREILGGCEETTTGVLRLAALDQAGELLFPMMAVNNAQCKYLFDNRYGTGESVWAGIMNTTNLVVAGKNVVVLGYGWCGKGVAMRAKGLGAKVIVCEVDPIKAIEASMDGFQVLASEKAAELGDIFVTVTSCIDALNQKHFAKMKDKAILANAGHFDVEINIVELSNMSVESRPARHNVRQYTMADGRRIYLLAEGRLVNLAAGNGHPAEIMDMSFAVQGLSLCYIKENATKMTAKLYQIPAEIDHQVSSLKLKSLDITIDQLTEKQICYLNSEK